MKNLKSKVLGIVPGGWCGSEVVNAALSVLRVIEKRSGSKFNTHLFQYDRWEDTEKNIQKFYPAIHKFYSEINKKGGAIIRGSINAEVVYRLRRDFDQLYKLAFFRYIPELAGSSFLLKNEAKKFDVLFVRENSHGPYHAEYSLELDPQKGQRATCHFSYSEKDLEYFAEICFKLAMSRKSKLHLFMKTEAMGEIGDLWLRSFERIHTNYPEVQFTNFSLGGAVAELYRKPKDFDVIVTPDVEGDILADQLGILLYGSMMVTASGNFARNGFASYQTLHGTVKPLANKDKVNPMGMIHALIMYLEHSCGMKEQAESIKGAVRRALELGYRTLDIYRHVNTEKLVGTKEMTKLIIKNL